MKQMCILLLLVLAASLIFSCAEPARVTTQGADLPSATPIQPTLTSLPPPTLTPTPSVTPEPKALKPGDTVGGMVLQQATDESMLQGLLWNYCDPGMGDGQSNTVSNQCDVPQFPFLFIGNGIGGLYGDEMDEVWDSFRWELYIDGLAVDLGVFGAIDIPETGFRLWNIGIEMPSIGQHSLKFITYQADTPQNRYETTWTITVKDLAEFPELSVVFPEQPTPMPEPERPVKLGSGGMPARG